MAITVRWDDGSVAVWEEASSYTVDDKAPRNAWVIKFTDVESEAMYTHRVVSVPDFGVRYIGDAPNEWRDASKD